MPRIASTITTGCAVLLALPALTVGLARPGRASADGVSPAAQRQELLAVRDSVWRSWYANDQARLRALIPADLIAIDPGGGPWQSRPECLTSAAAFAARHGRLLALDFPRTEMQIYGAVAILYSQYSVRFVVDDKEQSQRGRASEIFVRDRDHWRNAGWHLDSGS